MFSIVVIDPIKLLVKNSNWWLDLSDEAKRYVVLTMDGFSCALFYWNYLERDV